MGGLVDRKEALKVLDLEKVMKKNVKKAHLGYMEKG